MSTSWISDIKALDRKQIVIAFLLPMGTLFPGLAAIACFRFDLWTNLDIFKLILLAIAISIPSFFASVTANLESEKDRPGSNGADNLFVAIAAGAIMNMIVFYGCLAIYFDDPVSLQSFIFYTNIFTLILFGIITVTRLVQRRLRTKHNLGPENCSSRAIRLKPEA